MTFGNFNTRHRLGIANCQPPDGSRWTKEILRLPSDIGSFTFPVYQGLLVHDRDWGGKALGPGGAAESVVSGVADADVESPNIIREAALHRTDFSFPNVSASSTPTSQYSLQTYAGSRFNKVFFVNNEPEFWYLASSSDPQHLSNSIDNYNGIATSTFRTGFWEFTTNPQGQLIRRIKANAMGLVFLRLKKDFGNSRGHVVLPPCPAGAIAGSSNGQPSSYWLEFYDAIHRKQWPLPVDPATSITVGGQTEVKINPSTLHALHLHYYSAPRSYPNWPVNLPLETVAEGMFYLRKSVDWYRDRYFGLNQFMPLDVLLSEFGMYWQILSGDAPAHKWLWGGGWNNFRDGLSWWNSWMCWVMRRAPIDFKLTGATQGNYTDSRAVYANILEPQQSPYTTFATGEPNPYAPPGNYHWQLGNSAVNQFFFNCDTNATGILYGHEIINVTSMLTQGRFSSFFSAFPVTTWNDGYSKPNSVQSYRLGPFGACYKVWAEVGADVATGNLATGWVNTTQVNQGGTVTLNLQAGYSTVYIPIIKSQAGAYAAGTRFDVKWGTSETSFGYGEMSEFPDTQTVTTIYDTPNNNVNPPQLVPRNISADPQSVYSTMVFPVVCWTASPRNITLKVVRSHPVPGTPATGTAFAIGRPIVINRACSWLSNQ